jgi:hypothetical protein
MMVLRLMAPSAYRIAKHCTDAVSQGRAKANKLEDLAITGVAHRLLYNPRRDSLSVGHPQAVVSEMFHEMLAEIRAYGQGLLIIDQVSSNLIPTATSIPHDRAFSRLYARNDRNAFTAALHPEHEERIAVLPIGQAIICSNDDAASWLRIEQSK